MSGDRVDVLEAFDDLRQFAHPHLTVEDFVRFSNARARNECAPFLCEEFPALANVDASQVTEYNWEEWLSQQIKQHGEYMEVVTLPEHRHEFIDPLLELAESVQPTGILVVEAGERQA